MKKELTKSNIQRDAYKEKADKASKAKDAEKPVSAFVCIMIYILLAF